VFDTHIETPPLPPTQPPSPPPASRHPLNRWPKWIFLALLLLWAAGPLISLAIQHSDLRRDLTARLQAAFGRPVEVGRYHFSFFGPVLSAESVAVADDPRFGQEYFLRADSLSVGIRWLSLLRGRLELGTLSLSHPSLNLVRDPAGDWNLAGWLPYPAQPPTAPRAFHALAFRTIRIDDGRINFKRGPEKLPVGFVGVSGTVSTDASSPGQWRIDLDLSPWRAAVVVQQAGTLHVSGHIGGTSSRLRPAALDVSWPDASLPDLLRLVLGDDYGIRGDADLTLSARTYDSPRSPAAPAPMPAKDSSIRTASHNSSNARNAGKTAAASVASAANPANGWTIDAHAYLTQIHRWDLTWRPDNPSLNLAARVDWNPANPYFNFPSIALESPHSFAIASGRFLWDHSLPQKSRKNPPPPADFAISSSQVDVSYLLSWLRAFHPGIADDLAVHGFVAARGDLSAWPPRVTDASLSSDGIDLTSRGIRDSVHIRPLQFAYAKQSLSLVPVSVVWSPPSPAPPASSGRPAAAQPATPTAVALPDASFLLDLSAMVPAKPSRSQRPPRPSSKSSLAPSTGAAFHIAGSARDMRDLIAAATAFGWNISRGWDLSGPFACDLRWPGAAQPWLAWRARPVGSFDFGKGDFGEGDFGGVDGDARGTALSAPFLNHPVAKIRAHADLQPSGSVHVALSSATAFGTRWNGAFDRRAPAAEWQFVLSGDSLDAADLDRWLNPVWRENFFGRMLPFFNLQSRINAVPENLRASGRISLAGLNLGNLNVDNLQAALKVEGRHITLSGAIGEFYGGSLTGSLDAYLQAAPTYRASLDFSHVRIPDLTDPSPQLAGLFTGLFSGHATFQAQGANRAEALASLECHGAALAENAALLNISLADSIRDGQRHAGKSSFSQASASFTCRDRKIQLEDLRLVGSNVGTSVGPYGGFEGSGTVDFNRTLNLRLRVLSSNVAGNSPNHQSDAEAAPSSSENNAEASADTDADAGANTDAPPDASASPDASGPLDSSASATYSVTGPLSAPQVAPVSNARRPRSR
jgi:AsmA-like C-terminal region